MNEKSKLVNKVINNVAVFVQQDSIIKIDFNEYLKTIKGAMNINAAYFNYIFERRLNNESILEIYTKRIDKISDEDKNVIEALKDTVSSVFEIKKILKNGFVLYNIINEKTYEVESLVKMTAFRGMGIGQYVIARVCEYENQHFLLEISGVLAATKKDDALRFAVAKIIEHPEIVYKDNPKKLEEIEKDIKNIHKKFLEYFGTDEVLTMNKFADDLIGRFNDYAESDEKAEYKDLIKQPEEYRFFTVNEFNNSYDNFLENSLGGFSSHSQEYDVGIIFDKELGLYAIPFYGTFNQIFKTKDYTKILNYDKCIEYFIKNDKFPANLITRVASKHKNFEKIVNSVMGTKLTLDEMLNKYKSHYLKQKIVSSTTVLYRSIAFSNTLGIIEEEENRPHLDLEHKIGRNELCPCGSGKKYKLCCGKHN